MIYKLFEKNLVVYHGEDAVFLVPPVQTDGYKPSGKTISGKVFRFGDSIEVLEEEFLINDYTITLPANPDRREDYYYRYSLWVEDGSVKELYQYGNVILKNEH